MTGQVPLRGVVAAGKVMVMTFTDLVASNAALSGEVRRSHEALKIAQLTIDKIKVNCPERANVLNPHSVMNLLAFSYGANATGLPDQAIALAQKAMQISSRDQLLFSAFHHISVALFKKAQYREAEEAALKRLDCRTGFALLYIDLALAQVGTGNLVQARASLARAIEMRPQMVSRLIGGMTSMRDVEFVTRSTTFLCIALGAADLDSGSQRVS